MRERGSLFGFLSDPRLAPYTLGDVPVWLWSADATRILWGNPAAAAIFNVPSSTALTGHTIDPKGSAALQIARLAGTLSHGAPPRLERLRGFGGRVGGALLCSCSRISLFDRTLGILVVAAEPVGRLSLADKARRLLADCDEPLALFAADGSLLSATASALRQLNGAQSLVALGAAALGATALAAGRAEGEHGAGKLSIERIGADRAPALLVAFAAAAEQATPVRPSRPAASPIVQAPNAAPASAAAPVQPLRFVWQIDGDGHFTLESDEFKALIGPRTTAALGQSWSAIATTLGLDPDGLVARAFASRETWSGITVAFPADGTDARLPVELSGLPVFDRDRNFLGYRGFGVCREVARFRERASTGRPGVPSIEPPVFRDERPATAPHPPVNVVPFRSSAATEDGPALSPVEHGAFGELATRLSARLRSREKDKPEPPGDNAAAPASRAVAPVGPPPRAGRAPAERTATAKPTKPEATAARAHPDQRTILDRLPIGVLVYRLDKLIYANRAFLEWTGYEQLYALEEAGGLDALFVEPNSEEPGENNGGQSLTIATNQGDQVPVTARLFSSPWDGEPAMVLMLTGIGGANGVDRQTTLETALRHAKAELGEVRAILDVAADGVVVLEHERRVQSINDAAGRLFGYDSREMIGLPFTNLFAAESQREVLQLLSSAGTAGTASANKRCEVTGRHRDGGLIPMFMTVSRIKDHGDKLCAIFHDMTRWKKTEGDRHDVGRQSEQGSLAKSDFLAKISHEIRTPLNAIIGFSEVMMQERFGPIGNERYGQYLQDIHSSGSHLISLLNDLLDLSRIEAGKLDLHFTDVDLNELTQQSVELMLPQASRERIVIRTSLGSTLPAVTADARSVRQILLNLISNSIKFTGVGGQVIVSTARGNDSEVVLRVRHTGIGMSEQDVAAVLEPFRQIANAAHWGSGGTGLGLPLTKALAEANRASFKIRSAINAGTLVEVAFPGGRLAAE